MSRPPSGAKLQVVNWEKLLYKYRTNKKDMTKEALSKSGITPQQLAAVARAADAEFRFRTSRPRSRKGFQALQRLNEAHYGLVDTFDGDFQRAASFAQIAEQIGQGFAEQLQLRATRRDARNSD